MGAAHILKTDERLQNVATVAQRPLHSCDGRCKCSQLLVYRLALLELHEFIDLFLQSPQRVPTSNVNVGEVNRRFQGLLVTTF